MDDDLHTLCGAYAVHALPCAETALFGRHLLWCPRCAAEVRRLRESAARLALALAVTPPAALRSRVLAAAGRSRAGRSATGRSPDAAPDGRGPDSSSSPASPRPELAP